MNFTNKNFSYFLGLFSNDSVAYTLQMIHLWNWLKKQIDLKREYTYFDCAELITETLIFKGIRIDNEGRIMAEFMTKTGKKIWLSNLFSSAFFSHFENANKVAGKWIEK